jgi:RHS repeat-associated protein
MTSSRTSEGSGTIENTLAINIMNIIGQTSSDTLKKLKFSNMSLEQAYPDTSPLASQEMPQYGGEDPGGYTPQGRILYWYHPDYIQNVDLITDIDGAAYELFLYNPWGEQLHHWTSSSSSWTSPYRFNAKELDPETGLSYYGARYYQSKLGVWLSVDPMASNRIWLTPYQFVQNSPNLRIDPNGKLDWKPGLDDTGSPTYTAEKGDNANTLADQYNLTISQANQLVGSTPVQAGQTVINGDLVKKVTGSSILRLDLSFSNVTDQKIIDQFVFAVDYSKSKDKNGFFSTTYFLNTQYKSLVTASGKVRVNDEYLELEIQIPMYRSATFDGSSKATYLGNTANNIRSTAGKRFPNTSIIEFDLFHPNTKNRYHYYQILTPSSSSYKLYNRLK